MRVELQVTRKQLLLYSTNQTTRITGTISVGNTTETDQQRSMYWKYALPLVLCQSFLPKAEKMIKNS